MKQSAEALVRIKSVATIAATVTVLAATTTAAHAVAPVVKLKGSASLTQRSQASGKLKTAAKFHVTTTFSTDTPGAQLFTIQKAVVFFPDHAGTNGRLFPSCNAQQIVRFHGNISRCPKHSEIGSGTVTAQALQLGVTSHGRVSLFNGHRGKTITGNFRTLVPADINESLDAPLEQLHGGRYGEKLTLDIPHSLQEILTGVFVGVQRFDVTIGGTVRVHGVDYTFLKARTCPKWAVHGIFDFKNWTTGQTATVTADTKIHCTLG